MEQTKTTDIYSYITLEEANYALPVPVIGNWEWSMKDHIELSVLYKNSTYSTGKEDNKPFKNITRPILNLQYRAEGFDVKDIVMYIDDKDLYHLSFLINKFHEKWAIENDIDTFIDDMVESYIDFGGTLIKNVDEIAPEVVPLQSIVFCDQTDILSGPIGIKHFYSPDQLMDMAKVGWGDEKNGATISLEDLIVLAQDHKVKDKQDGKQTKTPGKYIEVYEVRGTLPERFLDDDKADSDKYVPQMQIVAFYTNDDGKGTGVTLFKGKETESIFKTILRDKIYGRALGLGGAEELFEPQVWTNYDVIRIKEMLDHASKIIYKTTDGSFTKNNDLKDMDNGDVAELTEGDISQIDNTPRSQAAFEKNIADWEAHAQQMGSANDAVLGESPKSGTPFKLQELVTAQGLGTHEYRKGKISTFLVKVYRDWVIPHLAKEITNEQKFMAELDLKEMQEVVEKILKKHANDKKKEAVLNGQEVPEQEEIAMSLEIEKERFMSNNVKPLEILKDEMKDAPINLRINIAGKQDYLRERVDKLVNVFRQILANPNVLANPSMAELFNRIIESSGLSPIDFSGMKELPQPQEAQPQPQL